ncbi:MAG: GSU2403 family nucleotidyltransferase fold protein [Pseudomonadota bacterium]
MDDLAAFARLIQAIEPWRAHLIFVGGWAHRLYRFHPLANAPTYQPILTRDTDLAFANQAPLEGDIKTALARAGFTEELSGEHVPPVTRYTLGDDDAGFYAEFLTPLQGSGMKRNGKPDVTIEKAGITAQKLRHLEILLINPWPIRVGQSQGLPLRKPIDLQVANPTSFLVQKLLIQEYRPYAKRTQDMLYIHDVLELFGASLAELNTLWLDLIGPTLPSKTVRRVIELSRETFSSVTDILRDAARIPQDRTLSPERLRAACQLALEQVLT